MNHIEYTGIIIWIKKYTSNLTIRCQDNPFPGKTIRYSTNIVGAEKEKWEDILREGDQITISGNVAEVKNYPYGDYIAVWNPTILGAKRIKTEEIEIGCDKDTTENHKQECQL